MQIIEYSSKYDEDVKDLLTELHKYIIDIDKEKYYILTPEFREKYFSRTMAEVKKYQGKIFLAQEEGKIVGLIIGLINNDAEKTYEYETPKRGRITELIITEGHRFKGLGQKLLSAMEGYYKKVGCKDVLIDVFGYNEKAQRFYYKNGYTNRNIEVMKKI